MKIILIKFILVFLVSISWAQNKDDVIARIGDKVISVEEFKYRYEFTPQVNRKNSDDIKSREELLYTLIAENLFAAEAEHLEMDTLNAFNTFYYPLEKMYARDALYKEMISDKVELNQKKLNEGLIRANNKLFVDYIFAQEKKNIYGAYDLLNSSTNFDSLVNHLENAEYVSQPYEVTYGKMYYQAEDAIYSLDMNEYTEPIESPEGWYIFRLVGKVTAVYSNNDQKNSLVKKVVGERTEDSVYNEFWLKFFQNKKITTDGPLFWYFADKVYEEVLTVKNRENIKVGEKIALSDESFSELRRNIHPDSLVKTFIKFENEPLSLGEFFNEFRYEGFYTLFTDKDKIAAQLSSRVKRRIELELLAREAYNRGMQNLPDVKFFTDIWKENYLSTLFKQKIVKNAGIDDADIAEYLKKSGRKEVFEDRINILELLTDSLETIKEALALSDNDQEFRKFILKHTKREWVKNNNGEFGFFPISEHGEIGKIASTMELGDVYGPLQTDNGYSLFKVIGKNQDSVSIDLENIDSETMIKIKYDKIKNDINELTAELAEKYNVTINKSLLNSLDLLNSQMVVFRYIGFGGRIQAFPYVSPFYEWKSNWEQKEKDAL